MQRCGFYYLDKFLNIVIGILPFSIIKIYYNNIDPIYSNFSEGSMETRNYLIDLHQNSITPLSLNKLWFIFKRENCENRGLE